MVCQSLIYVHGTIISDTYANISALATANSLKFDTLYQINDNTDAEGGDVLLRPVATNKFSKNADYIPAFDTTQRWSCIYDFDNNEIVELRDDLNNIVIGNDAVNAFVWGSSLFNNNYIKHLDGNPISFTDNGGTFSQNKIIDCASVSITVNALGVVRNNTFEANSAITISGVTGNIQYNNVSGDSTFNITMTTGNINYNKISGDASLTVNNAIPNARIWGNNIVSGGAMTYTNSDAQISYNTLSDWGVAQFTDYLAPAALAYGNIWSYCTVIVDNCDGVEIWANNVITSGTLNITNSTAGYVGGNTIEGLSELNLTLMSGAANVEANKLSGQSEINNSAAITGEIARNVLENGSSMNFNSAHAGTFFNNCLRANSDCTGGANAGITHNGNIVAATANAFAAAVNTSNTRVND